tara:strand:+ start:923 stop:1090 length:168 start_codon:yes stop_codon:yes gene_type:complete
MSGLIKLVLGLVITYFILAWALDNPDSATSIVSKLEAVFTSTFDFISENLFDKKE